MNKLEIFLNGDFNKITIKDESLEIVDILQELNCNDINKFCLLYGYIINKDLIKFIKVSNCDIYDDIESLPF